MGVYRKSTGLVEPGESPAARLQSSFRSKRTRFATPGAMRFVLRHAAGSGGTQALSLALLAGATNLARLPSKLRTEPRHVLAITRRSRPDAATTGVGQGLGRRVGVEG